MNRLFYSSTVLFLSKRACCPWRGTRPEQSCTPGRANVDVRIELLLGFRRLGDRLRRPYLLPAPLMARAAGESFIGSVNLRMPSYL